MDKRKFIHINKMSDGEKRVWTIAKLLDKDYNLNLCGVIKKYDGVENSEAEYTEELRKQIPDNFCLYPFAHFQLDPDGRARPCCKYKVGDDSWQASVPKLPSSNIGDLWEQPEFQKVRDEFLKNERPDSCKACWDEEAAGIPSMRLTRENGGKQHPYATFFHHIPKVYPKTLDFKLSNLCNLKCRICTPFLSSQWIKEIKDLKITNMGPVDSFTANSKEKFLEDPENEKILKEWAPTIDFLEFYGGEPLMQQEHDRILDIMSNHGTPSNTSLYYNTNSSICKESFFESWKKFNTVIINFSIDDVGNRFEYQRKNAIWKESLLNIQQYQQFAEKYNVNMKLRLYVTIGILNVFYLKEFVNTVKDLGIEIVFNMVHYPHYYSIVNLPTEIKDIVKEKLLTIDLTNLLSTESPSIEHIINFMYGSAYNPQLLQMFFERTKLHDAYRNESFQCTFPEFYSIIEKYET